MPSKIFTIDQELNINSIPHWVHAEVKVYALLAEVSERGEYWGSAYSFTAYEPRVESAEIERIGVWAHSGDGEFEQQVIDDLVINEAAREAIKLATKQAEEDDFE